MKKQPPDDPSRLIVFRDKACRGGWEPGQCASAIEAVFIALDELAYQEVRYYYLRKRRARWISTATRLAAWVSGTAGLLLPLLSSALYGGQPGPEGAVPRGFFAQTYVLFAIAAGFLAADSFFGGSNAHVRHVSTQLELERLITEFRLAWLHLRSRFATPDPSEPQVLEAFNLFQDFSARLFSTIVKEANLWGKTLVQKVDELQGTLSRGGERTT